MIRVWFNHWFSTSYGLIELMKRDKQIYVIASNKQISSVIKNVCDEWYQDSLEDGEKYIQYCLDFCRIHKIDVFVPRRNMVEISQNIDRFNNIGVKVMVDDYSIVGVLNDKVATYNYLKDCKDINIPDYIMVNTADEFIQAYNTLHKKYEQVCVKFVNDEGAMSYRRIIERTDNRFKRLRSYPSAEVFYEDYIDVLREVENFDDLIVMPYLSGNEISVDCLNTVSGLIAIPRYKSHARHEVIRYDDDILNMSEIIMRKTDLRYPCNIQFKMQNSIPYLLEINTRMSGGLQMSCLATGVNIPNIALNKVFGKNVKWILDREEKIVSYIEVPQLIIK